MEKIFFLYQRMFGHGFSLEDASLAVDVDLVCDKWEIEEDGDTLVTWKF